MRQTVFHLIITICGQAIKAFIVYKRQFPLYFILQLFERHREKLIPTTNIDYKDYIMYNIACILIACTDLATAYMLPPNTELLVLYVLSTLSFMLKRFQNQLKMTIFLDPKLRDEYMPLV